LDALGFPLIEVGHGIGLGASAKGLGAAAASDEEYMLAAAEAVTDNKWGMFCIPGVATLDQLDVAVAHGMDFVRIGCEVDEAALGQPFIERARKLGLYVFSNLLKSYAVDRDYFVRQAQSCLDYGAQCIYIVDSAGGMLPAEIGGLAAALRDAVPEVKLGFHGHHNLGMGVANALTSAELGFEVVDTSLQGLGRSAGNTPTEQFVAALVRAGFDVPYDPVDVMQAGEELARPLLRDPGINSLDLTAGLALFHSSYMNRILSVAKEHRIDPRQLILAVCDEDRASAPMALIERCAKTISDGTPTYSARMQKEYFGEEQK
jgi:4-hydroxy-2-oxovalerate aldolase